MDYSELHHDMSEIEMKSLRYNFADVNQIIMYETTNRNLPVYFYLNNSNLCFARML